MKCCECKKEVDTCNRDVPPKWYGTYTGMELMAVICSDCVAEPEKAKRWSESEWKLQKNL